MTGATEGPLSPGQERLWFLQQLDPAATAYGTSQAFRVEGRLDVALLARCLRAIVERHAILRTHFLVRDGQPWQVAVAAEHFALAIDDLRDRPAAERAREVEARCRHEVERPFALDRELPLRCRLLRQADDDALLVCTVHHLVADGWSLGIMIGELVALYRGGGDADAAGLAALPMTFVEHAARQRAGIEAGELDAAIEAWRRTLDGRLHPLALPADHPRRPVARFRGGRRPVALSPALLEALRARARAEGATLYMVVLAALAAQLHRYAGVPDVAIGSPVAGRGELALEPLIGFLANTVVVCTDLRGDPDFRTLVARVRQTALDAFARQDVPMERVMQALRVDRTLSQNPLFQVMFVLQNAPAGRLELPGLRLTPVELASATSKFDLLLSLEEGAAGLTGTLEYDADLFEPATVDRMVGHLRRILEAIAVDPALPVSRLPLLTGAELHRLTAVWSGGAPAPPPGCLHAIFEAAAVRFPDATAVVAPDGAWTYAALDAAADRLAAHLRGLGVGRDVLVGVCLERTRLLPLAVLGIWKAGGALVPLDPAHPRERLAYIADQARPPVLVSQRTLLDTGIAAATPVRLALDELVDGLGEGPRGPRAAADPDDLAYLVYSSGSTGAPKGIAMAHRPAVNLIRWQLGQPGLSGGRTLQFMSLGFDVIFQELFVTWAGGGSVHLISETLRRDPAGLVRFLDRERIERMFVPKVVLQTLAETAAELARWPSALREVFSSGEQLQITPQVEALLARTAATLHNHFGPSEAHVVATHTLAGEPAAWPRLPPVGRAIAGVRLYLTDRNLELVPIGVPGEVCIGGACLARGYLGKPGLTAERFVPDRFGPVPGQRLYRSGDLARWLPDGSLQFLGRVDKQVKIRGFLVEPAEVEAALGRHPAVREVVVVAVEDNPGDRRLVAYVVAAGDPPPPSALRSFLGERLPDYMIPAAFAFCAAIPLDANGKIDWKAVAALPVARPEVGIDYVAPGSATERQVAAAWAATLGVEQVGLDDNFFDLGGNSLLLLRVQARLRTALGVEVSSVELFQHPTVRALAARIDGAGAALAGDGPDALAEARAAGRATRDALAARRRGGRED